MSLQIHWSEGLFLRQHHLQVAQRSMLEAVRSDRRLRFPYPYGVVEIRVSRDELENMRIRFDKLRVVMPSGLELDLSDNTVIPALNIKPYSGKLTRTGLTIYLGVPLWFHNRANSFRPDQEPDPRVKLLYRLKEGDLVDENTGENPQAISFRQINARLMLYEEDHSDMEIIPLLRVVAASGEEVGLPRMDTEFAPPCLLLQGSQALMDLVRNLSEQVQASRKELVLQLTRGGFSMENLRGVQLEQILRLSVLSRFSASLPHRLAVEVTPFEIYLELRELLGELSALYPDRDTFDVADYNHDEPYAVFEELSEKIRAFLRGAVTPSFDKVSFEPTEGYFSLELNERQVILPNAYFLGIKTKMDPTALALFVENDDLFKLMPRKMVKAAVYGIPLKEERHPPLELPVQADLHYFRLKPSEKEDRWKQIVNERSMALNIKSSGVELKDASFTLYMTIPSGGGDI